MDLSKLWDGAGDLDEGGGVEDGQRRDSTPTRERGSTSPPPPRTTGLLGP